MDIKNLLFFFGSQMLPLTTNIKEAYKHGQDSEQNFIQNLSLFLCTFLKEHGQLVEKKTDLSETLMEVSTQHVIGLVQLDMATHTICMGASTRTIWHMYWIL